MTEATQTALIVSLVAAVPATIAAFAALMASLKSARKSEETLEQGKAIHILVNSNLDKVKADLASANSQISILLKHLKQQAAAPPEEIE